MPLNKAFSLLLFLLTLPLSAFTGAAVQWEANAGVYTSAKVFEEEAAAVLDQCGPAKLVMFPEYTSVFTALFIAEGTEKEDLLDSGTEVREYLDGFWGTQARQREIWILAGTYLEVSGDQLFNTALLYNPEGQEVLSQRKCFLGDPEKEFGLSAGSMERVKPFRIEGLDLALTICRDTYHPEWEEHFPPVDFWIDIKANELPYTEEYYSGALPSRLPDHPTDKGLTLSLVGSMLGYRFTGISSWYSQDSEMLQSWTETEPTLLFFPMEPSDD